MTHRVTTRIAHLHTEFIWCVDVSLTGSWNGPAVFFPHRGFDGRASFQLGALFPAEALVFQGHTCVSVGLYSSPRRGTVLGLACAVLVWGTFQAPDTVQR